MKYFLIIFCSIYLNAYEYIVTPNSVNFEKAISLKYIDSNTEMAKIDAKDKSLWLRLKLDNPTNKALTKYVVLQPYFLDNVLGYHKKNNSSTIFKHPYDKNKLVYDINLDANSSSEIYIKIPNYSDMVYLKSFDDFDDFFVDMVDKLVLEAAMFAILILVFLVSFIVGVFIKRASFIYYSLYVLSIACVLIFSNLLYTYLFKEAPPAYLLPIFYAVFALGPVWFVLSYVEFFKFYPKSKIFFQLASGGIIIYVLLVLLFPKEFTLASFTFIILVTSFFTTLILSLISIKHNKKAIFILLGWSNIFIVLVINFLVILGMIQLTYIKLTLIAYIGILLELFFFALALSYQLKQLQNEVLSLVQKTNENKIIIEKQSKFATIGEIFANIEHQWKAPINYLGSITTSIKSSVYLGEKLDTKNIQKQIHEIDTVIDEMSASMKEFRSMYLPSKSQESIELNKIIGETIGFFKKVSRQEDLKVIFTHKTPIKLNSFANQWRQVLLNFLQNSTEAAKRRDIKDQNIKIELSKDDRYFTLKFSDNSGGSPNIDKIFEPFVSEKKGSNYSGMGLYMVKQIVEDNLGSKIYAKNIDNGIEIIIKGDI